MTATLEPTREANGAAILVSTPPSPPTKAEIEEVEGALLALPQVAMPVTHVFAPGVYYREIFMPKGHFIIGHEHKTKHLNVVLSGRARVLIDGVVSELAAPAVFVSEAGVRKMLEITEDMRFATIHPTAGLEACGENIEQLEDALRTKSATFLAHERKEIEP